MHTYDHNQFCYCQKKNSTEFFSFSEDMQCLKIIFLLVFSKKKKWKSHHILCITFLLIDRICNAFFFFSGGVRENSHSWRSVEVRGLWENASVTVGLHLIH